MRYLMLIHDDPSRWQQPTSAHQDAIAPQIGTMQREFAAVLQSLSNPVSSSVVTRSPIRH